MVINIIDREFNFLGQIDEYESFIPTKKWHGIGNFELHLNVNNTHAEYLQKENIIFTDEKKAYVILYKEIDSVTNKLVVKGLELKSYLGRWIVYPPSGYAYYRVNSNVETIIKEYVNATLTRKGITKIEVAENQNRGITTVYQSRYKNLADELEKLSLASNLGWDISLDLDNKRFIFDVVEGRDATVNQDTLPPAIFAIEYDNIGEQKLTDSKLDYRNTAIVAGQGEGVDRAITVVGEGEGLDSFETFIDARDIENDNDLPARGNQKLSETQEILTFDSQVLTDKNLIYEEDFRLGDIVTIQNNQWNITTDRRITEITEIYESTGFRLDVAFGESLPTIIDLVKKATDAPIAEGGSEGGTGLPGQDGNDGVSIEYQWNGTELGIKREDEVNYQYTDLEGPQGPKGDDGLTTAVKVGSTQYNHTGGVVSLPAYPTALPADGGDADTVNGKTVGVSVPANAKFTDTITSINGKTGTIAKADIVALGIPAQDTVYTHPGSGTNPHGTTKGDIGLGSVQNYGIATQTEAEAGTSNVKYTTPLRVKQAIDKQLFVYDTNGDGVVDNADNASKLGGFDANYYVSTTYLQDIYDSLSNSLDGKVDNSRVLTDVPIDANFSDTITSINGKTGAITKADITALGIPAQDTVYSHPSSHPASMITESSTKRFVSDSEKSTWNSKSDTDTVTTINGKTGAISKADIVALGIPSQDTNTTYSEITTAEIDTGTASTLRTITGRRVKYILDKVQGWIGGLTKSDVGLSNVDNLSAASIRSGTTKSHVGLGSVLNYGIATQAEAQTGTSNVKYSTPLRVKQAIDANKEIAESGSNENGEYIKFDDGTMICYAKFIISDITANGVATKSWYFPSYFKSGTNPIVTVTGGTSSGSMANGAKISSGLAGGLPSYQVAYAAVQNTDTSTRDIGIFLTAIGRWK